MEIRKSAEQEEKPIVPQRICARCNRVIPRNMRYKRSRKYKGLLCQRCDNELWRAKGYASERDLCQRLQKLGFNTRRIPTSGAGKSDLPDVLAFHKERGLAMAFEVKAFNYRHRSVTVDVNQVKVCVQYLQEMRSSRDRRQAGVACKFLLGERCKSPWIIRLLDVSSEQNIKNIKNITVDIADVSDMPELTKPTLSKRSRHIIAVRQRKSAK